MTLRRKIYHISIRSYVNNSDQPPVPDPPGTSAQIFTKIKTLPESILSGSGFRFELFNLEGVCDHVKLELDDAVVAVVPEFLSISYESE